MEQKTPCTGATHAVRSSASHAAAKARERERAARHGAEQRDQEHVRSGEERGLRLEAARVAVGEQRLEVPADELLDGLAALADDQPAAARIELVRVSAAQAGARVLAAA